MHVLKHRQNYTSCKLCNQNTSHVKQSDTNLHISSQRL